MTSTVETASGISLTDGREVVGVFADAEGMRSAIDDLQNSGINRSEISTVANRRTLLRRTGRDYADVREIEDDPTIPRAIFISRRSLGDAEGVLIGASAYLPSVIAAGVGASTNMSDEALLLSVIVAGAAGGLAGFVGARWLGRRYDGALHAQLERGGIILWVGTHSRAQERRAQEILARHGAKDVHVH
ncbi:MAG: hypothetical protein HY057_01615 [Rhodospirillales bacterium]|nr:hypothetical protein [Rhodospirillales bacterium]